ncbi:transcriptional repressor [Paraburkholderia sp. USG1]|uniref:Fur family transcriptional regulator n=1 Tax=Paraburkholderia sp. USG1 TaxID=2952268 RepID=UPI002856D875|nr:transcriptional repressor [Paraburkholderia sp. USG1]MDR8398308.1 transcriptional repressor [Paraburkholderia sp. USG1]
MSSHEPTQAIDLMAAFSRRNRKHAAAPEEASAPADGLQEAGDSDSLMRQVKRLKSADLRPTTTRISVLAVLEQAAPDCLHANQILRELARLSGTETVGSTYRALKDLQECGLLIRSWNERGKTLYRLRPEGHGPGGNTLVCRCGRRLVAVEDSVLQETLTRLATREGFAVQDRPVFTISTVCAGCEHHAHSR